MNEDYDWEQHAANKQVARDKDMEDIKSGKITALELRKKNFMFSGLDFSKCVAIAPDGTKFRHP